MPTTEAPARPGTRKAQLGTLMAGQSVSLVADSMLNIAVAWTAVQLGGAAGVTALLLCATIPKGLMLIFGGAVADLFGPRFMLLKTTAGRVVLLAAGAVVMYFAQSMVAVLVVAGIEGTLLGLGAPSFGSILPRIVPGPNLMRANSLYSMVTRLAPIAGAPLGAWMIATNPLWVAMSIVVVTCSGALACLTYVTKGMGRPAAAPGKVSLLKRSWSGLHLLRDNNALLWLFVCAFVIDFTFGWPMSTALPLMAQQHGWGVDAVGVAVSAFSAGALVTTAVGSLIAHRLSLSIRLVATAGVIAVGLFAMALMPTAWWLAAVAFVVGMASGLNGPSIVTLYQALVPKDQMGAAMATLGLAGIGTTPFSVATFGAIAVVVGVQSTWLICAVLAIAGPITAVVVVRKATAHREPVIAVPEPVAAEV
ncbi:MAG TPA: MFS transporter [Pseudonocardiaceae bacterium]|nr:MFS transporter [Pseudonocardiaceae bacterium]